MDSEKRSSLPYRKGVVAVFINSEGLLLLGKRSNENGWQFPQGGIDHGETPEEALYREVLEEVGCNQFNILKKSEQIIKYDFPKTIHSKITKKYKGQEQYWFLCQYKENAEPDLKKAIDKEFKELAWKTSSEAINHIVIWKKEAYLQGLSKLAIST